MEKIKTRNPHFMASKKFNLDEYSTVDERISMFYADHPDGRIITDIFNYTPDDKVVFKATLYENGDNIANNTPKATGFAEETPEGYVNQTSRLENCETSAIGRALANAGYAGKKRPSREEMSKVERITSSRETSKPPAPKNDDVTFNLDEDIDPQIEASIENFTKIDSLLAFNREMTSLIKQEKLPGYTSISFQEKWNNRIREKMTQLKG